MSSTFEREKTRAQGNCHRAKVSQLATEGRQNSHPAYLHEKLLCWHAIPPPQHPVHKQSLCLLIIEHCGTQLLFIVHQRPFLASPALRTSFREDTVGTTGDTLLQGVYRKILIVFLHFPSLWWPLLHPKLGVFPAGWYPASHLVLWTV